LIIQRGSSNNALDVGPKSARALGLVASGVRCECGRAFVEVLKHCLQPLFHGWELDVGWTHPPRGSAQEKFVFLMLETISIVISGVVVASSVKRQANLFRDQAGAAFPLPWPRHAHRSRAWTVAGHGLLCPDMPNSQTIVNQRSQVLYQVIQSSSVVSFSSPGIPFQKASGMRQYSVVASRYGH
jgi:hypothetical protein